MSKVSFRSLSEKRVVSLTRAVLAAIRALRNWPSVLVHIGINSEKDLVLITRTGLNVVCPNLSMSRAPLFEILVDDQYNTRDLDELVPENAVVLDIGAHIGSFALAAAKRYGNSQIHCYEPSPSSYSYLKKNILRNGYQTRVSGVSAAVGSKSGLRTFYEFDDGSCVNSMFAASGASERSVEVVNFSSIIEDLGGHVDLLKLDCEGSEYEIILETDPQSWTGIATIILEYHPIDGHTFHQIKSRLNELGFTCNYEKPLHTPGLGMACFSRISARQIEV